MQHGVAAIGTLADVVPLVDENRRIHEVGSIVVRYRNSVPAVVGDELGPLQLDGLSRLKRRYDARRGAPSLVAAGPQLLR